MVCYFLLAFIFSDKKPAIIQIDVQIMHLYLWSISRFLSLDFRNLIVLCLGVDYFGLGFTQLLEPVGVCLTKFGEFSAFIFL